MAYGQEARLRRAEPVFLPTQIDGNSPSFWLNGRFKMFTSIGRPLQLSESDSQFGEWESREVDVGELQDKAIWVEAAWVDEDGTVFGWYHHEPAGLFEDSPLTAPKIGAVVSFDGGRTIHDLGIVLESGDPLDPGALNEAFAGGHGDFSVVLDRRGEFFYFFFTNYGGDEESQGVVMARMSFRERFDPVGKVFKYHQGDWIEPGLGGLVTPVFPAIRAWHHEDPDSYWGPSVHWNTYLKCHVMLLNRASSLRGWQQEGIYVSFGGDLSQPASWKRPQKILDRPDFPGWGTHYPQVIGLEQGGTDTLAGRIARFYQSGGSEWEIVFSPAIEAVPRISQPK